MHKELNGRQRGTRPTSSDAEDQCKGRKCLAQRLLNITAGEEESSHFTNFDRDFLRPTAILNQVDLVPAE
ncbi:hypothetical protein PFLUV_G00220180 [Perca fluviatilis]|uniref:Uncharacterized protein n=1 Tax=Perca fluviatilis TaxID=8168 RepID=A0A6A5EAX3_PERFL|nr:hypothetical protein PFLUV_G00220180 [Perca fluviatilis]